MRNFQFSILNFVVGLVLLAPSYALAFDVPPNDGFVTDSAELLTVPEDEALEGQLRTYKETTNTSIVVSIVDALGTEPIDDVAFQIGQEWGVGRTSDGQSVLIVIAYEDRQIIVEASPSLDDVLTEHVAAGIVTEEMMPSFRNGAYAETVSKGVDAVQKHLGGEYAADRYEGTAGKTPWMALWKAFLLLVVGAILADAIATLLRPQSTAWFGILMGVVVGSVMAFRYGVWMAVPMFAIIGGVCDAIVHFRLAARAASKRQAKRRRRRTSSGNDTGSLYEE